MYIFNPIDLMQTELPDMKSLSAEQQQEVAVRTALYGCCTYTIAFIALMVVCLLLGSCATPKVIEHTEHHYVAADTMAIQSVVDAHMSSWHTSLDSVFRECFRQYSEELTSQEQEQELIRETITVTTDSLGRAVRQEQRTISRDIRREQQQTVQLLEREMEIRLQTAIARQDSIWQQRLDLAVAHWQQADSTQQSVTPVAQDSRPWYRRWLDSLQWLAIGIVLAFAILLTRRWWRTNNRNK